MRGFVQALAVVAVMTTTAVAQPAPAPDVDDPWDRRWSVLAGYEVFALRDISRNLRPPDASPISWRGAGPAVSGRYEIARGRASHLIDVAAARAGSFSYEGPSQSTPASSADLANRVAAGYEYRRYPWRNLLVEGLDIGIGAQGLAARVGLDRHITRTLSARTRITGGGGTGVIALRWRGHDRLRLDASWANGVVVSSRTARHSAQPEAETHSGGNWVTNSMVRCDWRVSGTTALTVAWRRDFDGYASSHYSYAGYRHRIEFGGTYGR